MKMFRSDGEFFQFPFPDEFHDFIIFKTAHVGTIGNDYSLSKKDVKLPHCSTRCVFDSHENELLVALYTQHHPSLSSCTINSTY